MTSMFSGGTESLTKTGVREMSMSAQALAHGSRRAQSRLALALIAVWRRVFMSVPGGQLLYTRATTERSGASRLLLEARLFTS